MTPMEPLLPPQIHPTADVEPGARVGAGSRVWHRAHVRAGATIGAECIIGGGVFVDAGVTIGDRVKVQNAALLYQGVTLADGVFVGPRVTFTNDLYPRAVNPDGSLKSGADWVVTPTRVETAASIGAGSVIVAGVTIGPWAMIGAGSVVTRDVPAQALVLGIPAQQVGWVCVCGRRLARGDESAGAPWVCPGCAREFELGVIAGGRKVPAE